MLDIKEVERLLNEFVESPYRFIYFYTDGAVMTDEERKDGLKLEKKDLIEEKARYIYGQLFKEEVEKRLKK